MALPRKDVLKGKGELGKSLDGVDNLLAERRLALEEPLNAEGIFCKLLKRGNSVLLKDLGREQIVRLELKIDNQVSRRTWMDFSPMLGICRRTAEPRSQALLLTDRRTSRPCLTRMPLSRCRPISMMALLMRKA